MKIMALRTKGRSDRAMRELSATQPLGRSRTLTIMLVACEESGDRLGAALMRALKKSTGGAVRFVGVGGHDMAVEGLSSLFPIEILRSSGSAGFSQTAANHPSAHSQYGPSYHRLAARRTGDHRQPRIYPSGGTAGAGGSSINPDRQLCVTLGVGMATLAGAVDAELHRSRPGTFALRTSDLSAARRAAMYLCGSSARGAAR